ncbi:hypothetical protein IFR05_013523 [Cadophora sp. M221]|nr:hypothetical protein IFR05_013523 [Cadophora sp. M221]
MAPPRQQNASQADDHARILMRSTHDMLANSRAKFEEEKIARKKSRKKSSGLMADERDERAAKKTRTEEGAGPATYAGQAVEELAAEEIVSDEKARPALNTGETVEHRPAKKMRNNIIVLDDSDDELSIPQPKPRKSKAAKSSDTVKGEPSRFDSPSSILPPTSEPLPSILASDVAQDLNSNLQQTPNLTENPSQASIIQSLQAYPTLSTRPAHRSHKLRRVYEEPLVRKLELRPGKSFTLKNRQATKSALMYPRGTHPPQGPCKSCANATALSCRGPYQQCIIMHGECRRACCNCVYMNKATRCSFYMGPHGNNRIKKNQAPATSAEEGLSGEEDDDG